MCQTPSFNRAEVFIKIFFSKFYVCVDVFAVAQGILYSTVKLTV